MELTNGDSYQLFIVVFIKINFLLSLCFSSFIICTACIMNWHDKKFIATLLNLLQVSITRLSYII